MRQLKAGIAGVVAAAAVAGILVWGLFQTVLVPKAHADLNCNWFTQPSGCDFGVCVDDNGRNVWLCCCKGSHAPSDCTRLSGPNSSC